MKTLLATAIILFSQLSSAQQMYDKEDCKKAVLSVLRDAYEAGQKEAEYRSSVESFNRARYKEKPDILEFLEKEMKFRQAMAVNAENLLKTERAMLVSKCEVLGKFADQK